MQLQETAENKLTCQDLACKQRSCQRQDCSAVRDGCLQHTLHGVAGGSPQQQRCNVLRLSPAKSSQTTLAGSKSTRYNLASQLYFTERYLLYHEPGSLLKQIGEI